MKNTMTPSLTTMPKISDIIASRKNAAQPPAAADPAEPLISYYTAANAPEPAGAATLTAFIEAIQSDENQKAVTRLRERLAAGDEDGYAKVKRTLAAVSISGKTTNGGRAKSHEQGRFIHSGYMQIDLDGKDNVGWTVDEMREILRAEPRVVAAFVSPSGDGVKGVARIPADVSTHLGSFIAVREFFAQHKLKVDEACKDPGRLCFVSWDPDAWIDLSRTAVFEPVAEGASEIDFDAAGAPSKGLVLKMRSTAFPEPPANGIHTWLMQAAWWCRIHDMTEAATAAKLQGYDGTLRRRLQPTEAVDAAAKVFSVARDNSWKIAADVEALINPPAGSTATEYSPDDVFYDGPAGRYLIRVGNTYHMQSKRSPVITGLTRYLAKEHDDAKELAAAVKATIAARELDGGIQWSGNIAGHQQGLTRDVDGKPILILSEAQQPTPASGPCDLITDLIAQAFEDPTAFQVFVSWLAGRYRAVRDHTHIPSPMLVMAGEVNSGKSLVAWIAAQCLGGRTANPYNAWAGGMLWNDDLVGAEMLLVDDCAGSTDMRARRCFGAAFKEAMYPHIVQLRKRHSSSVSVRPVWACIVCCNDTPEALQIIPPLDADMSDKVILLHVSPLRLPVDTSTPAGRATLQTMIRNELPAFVHQLETWVTPEELHDTRSGIKAWRDPDLLDSVDANSPARRVETLITAAIENRGIWHDLPRELTAIEIETRLTDPHSPVRDQARALFHWHGACGSALSRLAKMGRGLVTEGTFNSDAKIKRYFIEQ
jgi:hypothetical protein